MLVVVDFAVPFWFSWLAAAAAAAAAAFAFLVPLDFEFDTDFARIDGG